MTSKYTEKMKRVKQIQSNLEYNVKLVHKELIFIGIIGPLGSWHGEDHRPIRVMAWRGPSAH